MFFSLLQKKRNNFFIKIDVKKYIILFAFKNYFFLVLVSFFVCGFFIQNAHAVTRTFTSSGTWTAPTGITSITVQAWGAGGGGGGGTGIGAGGGGGGGYSTLSGIAVTPSTTYTVTVGTGGSGGSSAANGTAGGNSWFNTTGTIIANGGARGNAGPLGAGGTGGSGDQFSGGNGGTGITTLGGGGGGGAGASGQGGNALSAIAGVAGSDGGGAGASGGTGVGNTDNTAPGGGGAGGGGANAGSAGAAGRVVITHAAIALTVSGITASNKTYDGTTSSTIDTGSAALVGVVAGDTVTLVTSGASGVFNSASVGTGKTVTISGLTISGADSGNYTLTQPTTTANITARALTVTASNQSLTYANSSLGTSAFSSSGLQNSETIGSVTLTSNASTSGSGNHVVGTSVITPSSATGGTFTASNYTITYATGTLTVSAAALTVSGITASNKSYDGTTSSTLSTGSAALVGRASGDTVTLNTASAVGIFDTANVGTSKTVTISGLTISGADSGNYTLTQPTTTANIIAATTSVAITESGGSTAVTEGGSADTYTIMLQSLPSSTVSVVLSSASTRFTLSTTTIVFTTLNWNTPQTITVTPVNDSIAMGNTTTSITHSASSGDLGYNGIAISAVSVSVTDDDTAAVQLSTTTLSVNEGTTNSYTIVLQSEPTSAVTVGLSVTSSDLTLSTSSITFSTSTWNTPRTVVVTAVEDSDHTSETELVISHDISSSDTTYSALSASSTVVSISDNDTGVTVTESGGSTLVTEGGSTDSYTIVLNTAPSTSVSIAVTTASSNITLSTSALTFTTSNWSTPQTITVSAVDDSSYEGTETATITHSASSSDTGYHNITIASVSVTITDNDSAPVSSTSSSMSQSSGSVPPSTFQIPVSVPSTVRQKQLLPGFVVGAVTTPQIGVQSNNRNSVLVFSGVEQAVNMALSRTGDFTNVSQQPFREQISWDVCQNETSCQPGLYQMYVQFFGVGGSVSAIYKEPVWYWGNAARVNGESTKNSDPTQEVYLYKQETRPEVYAVVDKVKYWIPTEKAFNDLRLSWADIQVANDEMIFALPTDRFTTLQEKISIKKSAPPAPSRVTSKKFDTILSQGDNNDMVLFLQTTLSRLGFFPKDVEPNGNFGPITKKSVADFQTKNGLEPVGIAGPKTRALLNKLIENL